ncbi:MAG: hypothetical protein WCJ60_02200 [bacterium]
MKLLYKVRSLWLLVFSNAYVLLTDKHFGYAIPENRELMERIQEELEILDLQLEEDINELLLMERYDD